MEISKPKRLPLPEGRPYSKYDSLRTALDTLTVGDMIEVKMNKSKLSAIRCIVGRISKNGRKFAIRTLAKDSETIKVGIWRIG